MHVIITLDVVAKYRDRIASLEEDIEEVLRLEKEEKEFAAAELQLHKATAMLRHREEILSRPKRSWFQSHRERMQEKGMSTCSRTICYYVMVAKSYAIFHNKSVPL